MLNFLFPRICALCEEENDLEICNSCRPKLRPVGGMSESSFTIESCFKYDEYSGKIIKDAKYNNKTQNAKLMARLMMEKHIDIFQENSLVIPVNTNFVTQVSRKYNVPSLICLYLKKMLNRHKKVVKFMPFLIRKRGFLVKSQVYLAREERLSNLLDVFYLTKGRDLLKNQNVILVDDVLTTGATSKVCASEILKHSPKQLTVLTFARVV